MNCIYLHVLSVSVYMHYGKYKVQLICQICHCIWWAQVGQDQSSQQCEQYNNARGQLWSISGCRATHTHLTFSDVCESVCVAWVETMWGWIGYTLTIIIISLLHSNVLSFIEMVNTKLWEM